MHIIITGEVQSGKSTLVAELIDFLRSRKTSLSGILAPGLWQNNQRQGFDIVDLNNGKRYPLAHLRTDARAGAVTPFEFFPEGLTAGNRALALKNCRNSSVIIVDEIGKLELKDSGWARFLAPLLTITTAHHIWIVRKKLVAAVCETWNFRPVKIIDVNNKNSLNLLKTILKKPEICHESQKDN